jgi:hypothetical protein
MSLNATMLAKHALGLFITDDSLLKDARLSPPRDVQQGMADLAAIKPLETVSLPDGERAVYFQWNEEKYVGITYELEAISDDVRSSSADSLQLIPIEESIEAFILFLIKELGLKVTTKDSRLIENEIVFPALESGLGVDIHATLNHLERFSLIKISHDSLFYENTSRKSLALFLSTFNPCYGSKDFILPSTIESIRELFQTDKEQLVEKNFFLSLNSSNARHAFLEIYRTLEFLFVFPRSKKLSDRLADKGCTIPLGAMDFARYCAQDLGWRRLEAESLRNLFVEYSLSDDRPFVELVSTIPAFLEIKTLTSAKGDEDYEKELTSLASSVSEKYYKIRNQTVHQFWPDEEIELTGPDYTHLIDFTMKAIVYYYKTYFQVKK